MADAVRFVYTGPPATAPTIADEPQSQAVSQGSSVTFSVTATGTEPLSYQWKKDGSDISGATAANFILSNVSQSDAASYTVMVSNAVGSDTSSVATLTVIDPPVITAQPISLTRNAGQSATVSVSVTGTAPFTYQWQKDGSDIADATASSLILNNVSQSDAGIYTVEVSNTAGTDISSDATLIVIVPPSITSQPASRTNNAGTTATFTVVASGTSPNYQWKKGGVNISGATAATLTLNNVSQTDAASYTVVVSNAAGSDTSSVATLTVIDQPVITSEPASLTRNAGQSATFSVTATGTSPNYQWKKGGVNISGATTSTLIFNSVSQSDAASYTVVVSNAAGSDTSSAAVLTVIDPPVITSQPDSRTNNAGTTATFSATASGTSPNYQWKKNGVNISGATTSALRLNNVSQGDVASYTVLVSNAAGSELSSAATLTVTDAPVITTGPANATANAGASASFSVVAGGTVPLSYQWKKDGNAISGATTSSLTLNNVSQSDAASYMVVVSNVAGSATSSAATLTVIEPPVITNQPASRTNTAGTMATFSVAVTGTSPAYQWLKGTNILVDDGKVSGATTDTLTLSNVGQSDAAEYTVAVSNSAGSDTSLAATLTVIDPPVITSQPVSVTVGAGSSASFTVTANGTAPLSYQWRKGGVDIAGATTTTLTLNNVSQSDAGNYTVYISNATGNATSSTAILTVTSAPVITSQPVSLTRNAGQSATFTVSATGSAPLSYQWKRNGTNMSGTVSPSFSLSSVTSADAASYTVLVSNGAGSALSTAAILTVLTPPVITSQPLSRTNTLGSTASFSVTVSGTAPLSYQWSWDGVAIMGATTSSLSLSNTTGSDAGSYSVVVTNVAGSVPSAGAALAFTGRPLFTKQPVSKLNALVGTSNTFLVTVTGTAPLSCQWRCNGVAIAGATATSYLVSDIVTASAGSYSVVVSNLAGVTTSASALLTTTNDVVRPTLTIATPTANTNLSANVFTATGTATDLAQVTNVAYSLNNAPYQSGTTTNKWKNWSAVLDGQLKAGTNTIKFMATDFSGNPSLVGALQTRSFIFNVPSLLTVSTNGTGTLSTNLNGLREVNKNYTVTATPGPGQIFTNWQVGTTSSASAKLVFTMQTNLVISANFIPTPFTPNVAGTYNGLFQEAGGVAFPSSGFLTLTVNSNGLYSGKIYLEGKLYSFVNAAFSPGGLGHVAVARTGKPALSVDLQIDLTGGSDSVSGTVSSPIEGWSANCLGYRALYSNTTPTPNVGKYTFIVPGTTDETQGPLGSGYGLITVSSNGTVALTGNLGDGTTEAQALGPPLPSASRDSGPYTCRFMRARARC
ncbi:MAG: C-terminal target protein [Pedosphaera sp.]|nr:C-terminal target protein [Pedosphaera sp.]